MRNFALALAILFAFSCGQTRATEQTPTQIKNSAASTFTANGAGAITGPNVGTAITNIADSFIPMLYATSGCYWRSNGLSLSASCETITPGSGSVTSVGAGFSGGLISVSGSPITTSGSFSFSVAGTSGGIPYFSGANSWASSALLAANSLMVGGGAGAAPATTTTGAGVLTALGIAPNASGGYVTVNGAVTVGNCLQWASGGGLQDTGATCGGGGGGSGTVTSVAQSFTGGLISVSGSPITTSGTLALTVAGTSGGIPYFSGASTWASSWALTANAIVLGGGAGAAPTPLGSLGTTTTVLHGNAAGAPTFGAVSLTADVSGTLPTGNLPTATAANVQAGTSSTTIVTPSALSGSAAAQTLTDGATINWDMASGYNAKITLTASGHTFAAPTNVIEGLTYTLQLDVGAGPYTANWDAVFNWGAAGTPTLSTGASDVDVVTCLARATNNLLCSISQGF